MNSDFDDGVFDGPVPQVEASDVHRAFVRAAEPNTILVPIIEARKLVNKNETAASFYGDEPTVITTTTIRDEHLRWITPVDELQIVRDFGADGHVPSDRSVYEDQSTDEQLERILRYLEGVIWFSEARQDETEAGNGTGADLSLVPLVKGLHRSEREVAYRVYDDLDIGQYSFYGGQYFSGGAGPMELVQDIREVAAEIDRPLFVIGLLSPTYLRRLPDTVVAASGLNQWRTAVQPRQNEDDPDEMRRRWHEFADEVCTALR